MNNAFKVCLKIHQAFSLDLPTKVSKEVTDLFLDVVKCPENGG